MMHLVCPLCRELLCGKESTLVCPAGHSYDIARSGYVNLLPPGRRSNARTGDDSGMVAARRNFLSRGYYDRYVTESAEAVKRFLGKNPEFLIDAACGEGHHTRILSKVSGSALTLGVDASKKAADAAARSSRDDKSISFIAGNIFDLPIASSCADAFSVLFAPIPYKEALRVLRPGGCLLICSAAPDHLAELRQIIYDDVITKETAVPAHESFTLGFRENIKYTVELDAAELVSLFEMTPFRYRSRPDAAERVASHGKSRMTVSVMCNILIKNPNTFQ